MSGDVQPRKRKDKKKKKDDLGIEEPRGTAAALGEGDIFMHSHHEHDTGGHWCAKVIFFSLLAVLVTLIGLIILENRGLSELEANSVESRYSGVLEGWLEDGRDDDHHDEHTLDLNHHDDDDHAEEIDHDNEDHDDELEHDDHDDDGDDDHDEHEDERDDDENEGNDDENDDDQDEIDQEDNDDGDSQEANEDKENSEERNLETAEDEDEINERNYRRYYQGENQVDDDDDDEDDDEVLQKVNANDDNDESAQNDDNDDNQHHVEDNDDSQENDDDDNNDQEQKDENDDSKENDEEEAEDSEEEDEHEEHEAEDSDVEVEHIEREVFDDYVSTEAPAEPEDDNSEEVSNEATHVDEADEEEVEFLEPDDSEELPDVMPIPISKAKPLREVDDISTEKPQDTLADEEEYERQQEELQKQKEETSQGMWLKLVVGGALLVATQAVLRRATAPREPEDEVDTVREDTPLSDRRMTLIAEPVASPHVTPKPQEVSRPVVQKEIVKQAPVAQAASPPEEDEDVEEEEEIFITKDIEPVAAGKDTVDKELYSDEEEAEDEEEEEIIEEKREVPKPTASKPTAPIREPPKPEPVREILKPLTPVEKKVSPKPVEKEPTPEEEYDDDDVEIIEEEDIGEELEEEDDISDVDDAELLTRLEAKYGRLPEPERPGTKKDGGNSIEDEWPGEPSDAYWREELDQADRDLRQGEWTAAAERASAAQLRSSARARYVIARALDSAAEAKRDNALLTKAVAAYLELLKMNERLSDKKLIEVTDRALDRIKFRGNYLGAEPIYRLLIRRFPNDPTHRNNLTVSFLMANRVDLAEEVIKETLKRWPNDRVALAHYGFILKTLHNKVEEAVDAFTKALEGDTGPANEPRFYYHLGDSLLLLGRFKEAHEVHKRGAKLGHFLSPSQRSLYNVERLKSKPWWDVDKTPYARLARELEKSWKDILKEGQAAQELYEKEKEGLKERGEWSQLDLFMRGREVPNRCSRAPVTCNIVRLETSASGCRRGQVKFSSMEAGTHVRPHVGPTNCRLRMHLGLTNTKDTFIRVDQEIRQWQTGKVLMFDDSFEHEVWHNGTGTRLVLIVDVWHPDLTVNERRQLPAI